MTRGISSFILCAFILWILPLGVFIRPSQEKAFCGGQRAICLCSHMTAKNKRAETVKTIAKAESGSQKEESSGSSHYYDSLVRSSVSNQSAAAQLSRPTFLYQMLVSRPVEHVPKA